MQGRPAGPDDGKEVDREEWLRQYISAAKERAYDKELSEHADHLWRAAAGQDTMYPGKLNRFATKKRSHAYGAPPPPPSGRSPPSQGRAGAWPEWLFFHGLTKRTGCVISCLGLLGMLSLAVQHWGMLPLVKNLRLQKQPGNASIAGHARQLLPRLTATKSERSKQSAAGDAAARAFVNRSRTADPEAGAKCVGFAVVRNRDIAAGDVGSQHTQTVVSVRARATARARVSARVRVRVRARARERDGESGREGEREGMRE